MARRQKQLELPAPRTWGGARRGAGRRPIPRHRGHVGHRIRPDHVARFPVHVTLRVRHEIPSLRDRGAFPAIRHALFLASNSAFRVIHFSVQHDHIHLIVEADDAKPLSRGLSLKTPVEARSGILYVLQNWKKHLRGVRGVDPCSSGQWFTPVTQPRTWLAARGWRERGGGPLDTSEAPA
jgi:hypothetical protein